MRWMVSSLLANGWFPRVRRPAIQSPGYPGHLQWCGRVQSAGVVSGSMLLALAISEPAAHAQRFEFDYTGSLVNFTVPITGTYQIIAFGAQGGDGVGSGGRGAEIGGDFSLTAGETPQPGAIGGGKRRLVLRRRCRLQQQRYLLDAEHRQYASRVRHHGEPPRQVWPVQRHREEETQGRD